MTEDTLVRPVIIVPWRAIKWFLIVASAAAVVFGALYIAAVVLEPIPVDVSHQVGAAEEREALRVATFGTSLTALSGWQPDLQEHLAVCLDRPVRVLNFGKPAVASDWGLQNVSSVRAARPDIVVIEFAINDAKSPYAISLERSRENTLRIIRELRVSRLQPRIWLMTTNPVGSGTDRPELPAYYAQYRAIAAEARTGLIDLYADWVDAEVPDGLHPTLAAWRLVVPKIAEALCNK